MVKSRQTSDDTFEERMRTIRTFVRSFGRLLQGVGLAVAAIALAAGLNVHGARALVGSAIPALILPSPSPSASLEPDASVSPKPKLTPSPGPKLASGGPLQLNVTGSLSFGSSITQTTLSALPTPGATPQTTNQSSTTSAVGLLAEISRRTGSTTTDLRLPFGFSNRGSTIGLATLTFSTPHFELAYGSVSSTIFGILPSATTLRGPSLTVPFGAGDITAFGGPTYGVNQEVIRMIGIRGRRLLKSKLIEFGLTQGAGGTQTGPSSTALFGIAAPRGNASFIGEFAYQRRQAPDTTLAGFAYAMRLDSGVGNNGFTLNYRRIPARYLILGAGEAPYDNAIDLAFRGSHGRTSSSVNATFETTSLSGITTAQQRFGFTLFGPLHRLTYSLTAQSQKLLSNTATQWIGGLTTQLSAPIRQGVISVGSQISRSTQTGGAPLAGIGYSLQAQRQLGSASININKQWLRQISATLGTTRQAVTNIAINRTIGKTSYGFSYVELRTQSLTSNATQRTPLISIGRRISPVLSVQAAYGVQSLVDTMNPASNGKSKIFNIQFNAPFAFGNGAVQGRIDPRLPAIIQGRVINDLGNNPGLLSFAPGGIANVAVVLDSTTVQRTDLEGNFQFNFIAPGEHQVRIETGSIPPGLTVDQPVVSLSLQGGQTGQVYFRVGNFGGIGGRVDARDASGGLLPLQNVQIRVDGGAYSVTDQQGNYGFGRLAPGEHTITVIENSIPAFANFPKSELTQKVSVSNGKVTTVNFDAEPLGSISGKVLYDVSLIREYKGGVNNAYVVAEPGDHAAIANDDGSFILDDLPPDTYTLSIDPETVPDQTGQISPNVVVVLGAQEHKKDVLFLVGHEIKKVIFSFLGGGGSQTTASLSLSEPRLPPLGSTDVTVSAAQNAKRVTVTAFGRSYDAKYVAGKGWLTQVVVPSAAKAGKVTVISVAETDSGSTTSHAVLTVDPKLALVIISTRPTQLRIGEAVQVHARFLVAAKPGDKIAWEDGTSTILGKPVIGRVFVFSVTIRRLPYQGVLISGAERTPIVIR